MQSTSAEQREPHSALVVGAAFGSKSLRPIVVKRPSEGPSALWAQGKSPATQLRQPPKVSSKTVPAGGGDGDIDGGGGEGEAEGGGNGEAEGGGEGGDGGAAGITDGGDGCGDAAAGSLM